jgi:hypothetical protein
MGRPKKLVPELWYQESESCWMAKFNGRRRRYGPDREQALERFRADLAIHLSGGQVGPAKVATAPSALTLAKLCQAHLDRVKDRLSAKGPRAVRIVRGEGEASTHASEGTQPALPP